MKKPSPKILKQRRRADRARRSTLEKWCAIRESDGCEQSTLSVITGYTLRYGLRTVGRWIRIAQTRVPVRSDYELGCYISGIRRSEFPEDDPSKGKVIRIDSPRPPRDRANGKGSKA